MLIKCVLVICSVDLNAKVQPVLMVLKETLSYYINNGGTVFCSLIDARKRLIEFDYVKMFKLLFNRKLPSVCLRLLLNLYTNHVTRVAWNGVCSNSFSVFN